MIQVFCFYYFFKFINLLEKFTLNLLNIQSQSCMISIVYTDIRMYNAY